MATRSDCVVFLNWFEYLRNVAVGAGVSIPALLSSRISQARGYFEVRRYGTAYNMVSSAVREFRTILKGERVQLKARCDALVRTITATLDAARTERIGVDAFTSPFNGALAMYNGEDFIAAFHVLSNLAEDISRYLSNARMGLWVDPLTGTYDIPAGTTDIITIEVFQPESAGWAYISADVIREQAEKIVRDVGGEAVLEIRYTPPRLIIFAKGSPLLWFVPVILIAILVVVPIVWAIGTFFIGPWKMAEETGKLQRRKAELTADYQKYLADKVAAGELSPEVADQLSDDFSEEMEKIEMPEVGPGIMDIIKYGAVAGIVVLSLAYLLPRLRKK